jgi:uncharacterized lipoprotein YajG
MKQIITSNKAILAAALLTLGLTGCAITPATESINYQAQTGVAHVAHAENVMVNVVTTDSRADKVIGNKKNGFGMKLADINSDIPVDVIVNHAIEQELKSRGFNVAKNSGLKVTADVTKFYNEFQAGVFTAYADGETNITVVVSSNGNQIFNKNINGKSRMFVQLATGSNAKESVENALTDAMTNLFNDPSFIAALTTAAPAQAASN